MRLLSEKHSDNGLQGAASHLGAPSHESCCVCVVMPILVCLHLWPTRSMIACSYQQYRQMAAAVERVVANYCS